MSDEIIVMSKGRIEQRGTPNDIYERPVNRYVSNFIGVANLLAGRIERLTAPEHAEIEVELDGRRLRLPCRPGVDVTQGDRAVLSIRPEHITAEREARSIPRIEGEVVESIFLGNSVDCRVRSGEFEWKLTAHPRIRLRRGERVFLRLDPEHTLAVKP